MNILIVEDDPEVAKTIQEEIRRLPVSTNISCTTNQTSAVHMLEECFYDLIILDLRIPTEENSGNDSVTHGISVFTSAKTLARGTPILVLTGSSADDHIDTILKHSERKDVWGQGREIPMVDFLKKHRLGELPEKLAGYASAIKEVLDIEVSRAGVDLTTEEIRLLRIFSKHHKAGRCIVTKIGGGLSNTKVLRLNVLDCQGSTIHDAVCKLGTIEMIQDESHRYDQHISRLNQAATPRKLNDLYVGAKMTGGVFYGLAQGFSRTGFDLAVTQQGVESRDMLGLLESLLAPWAAGESRRKIRDIRRRLLRDEDFNRVSSLLTIEWLHSFEENEVQTRWSCTHGDLHGLNVLVSESGAPILIDYGDVEDGPASLDPLTLELSLLFHPAGPLREGKWPSVDQASEWGNLTAYLDNCPCADYVRACRQWSHRAAAAEREIAATAYAYLLRQLKYDNPPVVLIQALLEGARKMYEAA